MTLSFDHFDAELSPQLFPLLATALHADTSSIVVVLNHELAIEYLNTAGMRRFLRKPNCTTECHLRDVYPEQVTKEREQVARDVFQTGACISIDGVVHGEGLRFSMMRKKLKPSQYEVVLLTICPLRNISWMPSAAANPTVIAKYHDLGVLRPLTARETQILAFIAQGRSTIEIADMLVRSRRTIDCHRSAVSQKLNVSGLAELTAVALHCGIIQHSGAVDTARGEFLRIYRPLLASLIELKRSGVALLGSSRRGASIHS